MIITGLDFEATSLDTQTAAIIEIGGVAWDTELQMPVRMVSEFVDAGVEISAETTELTGITNDIVERYGIGSDRAMGLVNGLISEADYVIAHNCAIYDLPLYKATVARLGVEEIDKLWIDSRTDIVFPPSITTRNLKHLAAEHSFLPGFSHRAVFDVMTMFRIASMYDWDKTIARAKEPTVFVQALVDFKTNQKAKDFRFFWNPERKMWWRSYKQSDFIMDREKFEFQYNMLLTAPE